MKIIMTIGNNATKTQCKVCLFLRETRANVSRPVVHPCRRKSRFVAPTFPISPNLPSISACAAVAESDTLRSPLAIRTLSLTLSTHALLSSLISICFALGPAMPNELSSSAQLSRELDLDRVESPDDGASGLATEASGVLGNVLLAARSSTAALLLDLRTCRGVTGEYDSCAD